MFYSVFKTCIILFGCSFRFIRDIYSSAKRPEAVFADEVMWRCPTNITSSAIDPWTYRRIAGNFNWGPTDLPKWLPISQKRSLRHATIKIFFTGLGVLGLQRMPMPMENCRLALIGIFWRRGTRKLYRCTGRCFWSLGSAWNKIHQFPVSVSLTFLFNHQQTYSWFLQLWNEPVVHSFRLPLILPRQPEISFVLLFH